MTDEIKPMRIDLLEPWKKALMKNFFHLTTCEKCGYKRGLGYWQKELPNGIAYDHGCACGKSGKQYAHDDTLYQYLLPERGLIYGIEKFITENGEELPE